RMVLHAVDGEPRPRDGDDAIDHADRETLLLEERALLDVQLEIGAERTGNAGLGADIAAGLRLAHEPAATLVARVVGVFGRDLASHHAAGEHRRLKPRAFLVGEDGERHGMPGPDPVRVERAECLEPAENAELTVIFAAGGDGVHVRAHDDRRQRLPARALAEDAAHRVDRDAQPRVAHPAQHEVATALVLVGEGQTGEPTTRRRADAAELVDGLLEPLAVDADVTVGAHGLSLYNGVDRRRHPNP